MFVSLIEVKEKNDDVVAVEGITALQLCSGISLFSNLSEFPTLPSFPRGTKLTRFPWAAAAKVEAQTLHVDVPPIACAPLALAPNAPRQGSVLGFPVSRWV